MKKKLKPVELFLSLGLATTLIACGPSSETGGESASEETSTEEVAAEGGEEGEGGESGEGGEGEASGDPDVDYMTTLALMKGHLIVAEELIEAGSFEEAEPHIGHPVEELYGDIEDDLSERQVDDFKPELNQLLDLAKSAPESPEMKVQFESAIASIDDAIAAIPEDLRQSPDFVLDVISRSLNTAAEEYEAAIADNKFVEIVEYQDSRGFVKYADELYQGISPEMSEANPEAHATITASLSELQEAWPSIEPPTTPIKSPEDIYTLVTAIEQSK